jgi:Holliday junction DNA helicase RuvB
LSVSPMPAGAAERTRNPLRPTRFNEIVGQDTAKELMQAAVSSCFERHGPMDHTLLVGPSGAGKSTFSHVVANELGVDVYELEAPINTDTLLELRTTMRPWDILKIEEIHQQAIGERRGKSASTQPEVLYAIMEDRTMPTQSGILPYPEICIIGTTTDEGMLPDAFINRFPLRPRLEPYTREQLVAIAQHNAAALGATLATDAADLIAGASRGVPRQINNYVKNAVMFERRNLTAAVVEKVLRVNGVTPDGLTADMQAMLTFLLTKARRERGDGEVTHQASVSTIATAIGKSRDAKAVALRIEPYLIEKGYVQVGHGGRSLTDAGIARARQLLGGAA